MSQQVFGGSCFCGAVRVRYTTEVTPDNWSVRACQCAFCRKHHALSTSDPAGSLEFACNDPERLKRYRFALKTADFLLCRECGVYVGAVIETPAGRFGIVNTHALDALPDDVADVGAISYDGEDQSSRTRRREERWTPVAAVPW